MAEHIKSAARTAAAPPMPVTVPMALVSGLVAGVRARGEPIDGFLADAGIPIDLLGHAGARVTAAQYSTLFRGLIERRDDEGLGFYSRRLKLGSFALLARSALGAPDLEAALRRAARSFRLLQDDVVLETRGDGDLVGMALNFEPGARDAPIFMHEMLLRIFWRLLAWLAGGKLPAVRFDFAFDPPPHAASYGRIFPAPRAFGCERSALWFDAARLRAPVRRDERALRALVAEGYATIILPRRTGGDVTGARVRSHLQATQPAWPDLAAVAGALHMSTATLQRRLALEGTSFQALKDDLRRDIAIVRLHASAVPLVVLAQDLGFSDSAAFQRAFKGWTGSAPGAYRTGKPAGPRA